MRIFKPASLLLLLKLGTNLIFSQPEKCQLCTKELSGSELYKLSELSQPKRLKPKGEFLKPILIPRVSGSKNNTLVRNFIVDKLKESNFEVDLDSFEEDTPQGRKKFTNIVATFDKKVDKKLVFAAHYDSKFFMEPNHFLAAIDSAVSCALLLDLADTLKDKLEKHRQFANTTLQLIFFDGEEAFEDWTDTDSIYGARHLAKKLKDNLIPPSIKKTNTFKNEIQTIELFVLLDLLGSRNTPLISLKRDTDMFFQQLVNIEAKIFKNKLQPNSLYLKQFSNKKFFYAGIDDDHRPFENLDVPILHLIPVPFPRFWHTFGDDDTIVHSPTVNHLALVFRAFIVQYLCLLD